LEKMEIFLVRNSYNIILEGNFPLQWLPRNTYFEKVVRTRGDKKGKQHHLFTCISEKEKDEENAIV